MSQPEQPKGNTSRRGFLAGAAGTAGALAAGKLAGAQPLRKDPKPGKKQPLNVLFIMSDDMRPELGCYGSRSDAQTPDVDKLAGREVRFDRNYCQFPLCEPSRSSMFTGRPPHTTGVLSNGVGVTQLHPDWVTLPHPFRNSGYTTLRTGKLFTPALVTTGRGRCSTAKPKRCTRPQPAARRHSAQADSYAGWRASVLPQDNVRAAHSDEPLILEGDGAGAGDAIVADRTLANQRARHAAGKPFLIGCGFQTAFGPIRLRPMQYEVSPRRFTSRSSESVSRRHKAERALRRVPILLCVFGS